jgi:hypothetical protein
MPACLKISWPARNVPTKVPVGGTREGGVKWTGRSGKRRHTCMLLKIGIGCLKKDFDSIEGGNNCFCLSRYMVKRTEVDRATKDIQHIPQFHRQNPSARRSGGFAYCGGPWQHRNSYEGKSLQMPCEQVPALMVPDPFGECRA